jgi:septal ring factor EnvC (AmiA/AmiB activator)
MKINESTVLKLDLKTILSIIVLTSSFVGMYYTLQADIEEAKQLPPSEVKRLEYDLREEWNEKMILGLNDRIDVLEETIDILSEEILVTSSMLKDGTESDKKFDELNERLEQLQKQKPQVIIKEVSSKKRR